MFAHVVTTNKLLPGFQVPLSLILPLFNGKLFAKTPTAGIIVPRRQAPASYTISEVHVIFVSLSYSV